MTDVTPHPKEAQTKPGDFNLVSDPEHSEPREDWYCGCSILHSPLADWCMTCRVAAPWMTWAVLPVPEERPADWTEVTCDCGADVIGQHHMKDCARHLALNAGDAGGVGVEAGERSAIAVLALNLLEELKPWQMQRPNVREACFKLTMSDASTLIEAIKNGETTAAEPERCAVCGSNRSRRRRRRTGSGAKRPVLWSRLRCGGTREAPPQLCAGSSCWDLGSMERCLRSDSRPRGMGVVACRAGGNVACSHVCGVRSGVPRVKRSPLLRRTRLKATAKRRTPEEIVDAMQRPNVREACFKLTVALAVAPLPASTTQPESGEES